MSEIEHLTRRCEREKRARKQAEALLEQKSLDLYKLNQELAQLAADLAEREGLMRSILEAVGDGIFGVDENGCTTFINPVGAKMLGWTPEEIIGCNHHQMVHHTKLDGSPYPAHECPIYSAFKDGKVNYEDGELFWRADGSSFPVEYVSTPLYKHGELKGAVITFSDIAERKAHEKEQNMLEIQLRHAQKLESIGQLAAGIAHEINTPTQFVSDNTRFLHESFEDLGQFIEACNHLLEAAGKAPVSAGQLGKVKELSEEIDLDYLLEEIPKAISQSQDGLKRISKIVRAMKEFSHPGTEEKTPIDINVAIQSTIDVSRNEWKYHANMVTDLDPDLPLVPCIPGEFNQVILNTIVNGAHAIADIAGDSPEEMGTITIRTCWEGDWAKVTISDTGTGIPESVRARIFDPFFTTKEVGKGTGQGLAIVYSAVVDKHSGRLDVESEIGKGTTFTIRLPLYSKTEGQQSG